MGDEGWDGDVIRARRASLHTLHSSRIVAANDSMNGKTEIPKLRNCESRICLYQEEVQLAKPHFAEIPFVPSLLAAVRSRGSHRITNTPHHSKIDLKHPTLSTTRIPSETRRPPITVASCSNPPFRSESCHGSPRQ